MIIRSLLLAGVLGASSLGAQATMSGWYTETHVVSRVEGERAPASLARDETTRSWRTAAAERVEGGLPPSPGYDTTGAYQISRPSEKRAYQVFPSARTIRVLDIASLAALKFDLPVVDTPELKELGDGGIILGHRTRKYRMTVRMHVPGMMRKGDTTVFTSEQTLWAATDPSDPLVAAYLAGRPKWENPLKIPAPPGMVLRFESRSHGISPYTTVRIREVVVWRREIIDPSRFAMPEDYKRVSMADETSASRAKLTSLRIATESRRVAGEELKRLMASQDPKDKARARVLGDSLFKAMRPDTTRLKQLMRNDPNAVRITDTVPARKKP